jgi:hypothetical protein
MNQISRRIGSAIGSQIVLLIGFKLFIASWWTALGYSLIAFIGFAYLVNSFKEMVQAKVIMQTYLDQMEVLRLQMVAKVSCAYCSKVNAVRFRMDERNEFECEHCKKTNLLMVEATTAQVTTPLVVPNLPEQKI